MKKYFLFFLATIIIVALSACANNNTEKSSTETGLNKIEIYTTVYPLSYFAERIGGDYVNVSSIYPPGANEHTFEPTQKDMMSLADADLFFYIGLGLEGFVENAKETLKNEDVKLVATGSNLSEEELAVSTGHTHGEAIGDNHDEHNHVEATEENHDEHDHGEATEEDHDEHNHGDIDPHVWLSPKNAQVLALSIKNELVAKMPEQEQTFNTNYEQLLGELQALDKEFAQMAQEATSKTFFVSHAAFGYIAGEYGLQQVPIAGLNSQSEPSQKELTKIVDYAKELNIQYVLFEQNVSSNLTTLIQNEIGAKSLVLHNLSVLTKEDIQNNETYFTIMEKNIQTLKTALNP